MLYRLSESLHVCSIWLIPSGVPLSYVGYLRVSAYVIFSFLIETNTKMMWVPEYSLTVKELRLSCTVLVSYGYTCGHPQVSM